MNWPRPCPKRKHALKRNHAWSVALFLLFLLSLAIAAPQAAQAQSNGSVHGQVLDPSGAVVPGAKLTLTGGGHVLNAQSGKDGAYSFTAVAPGSYTLTVDAAGFAPFSKAECIGPCGTGLASECAAHDRGAAAGRRPFRAKAPA